MNFTNIFFKTVALLIFISMSPLAHAQVIKGTVTNELGMGVSNVEVHLGSYSTFTDETGAYSLGELGDIQNGDYTLSLSKSGHVLNGVTSFDVIQSQGHILGIDLLTSYQLIAADVNNDGNITSFDAVIMRQLILGFIDELPNNDSWKFIDKAYIFPSNNDPWEDPFPEVNDITFPLSEEKTYDFIAIKIGDINNSAFLHE